MAKVTTILLDMKQKIEQGVYTAGSLLPSENQLTAEYGVSRETVRKALRSLVEAGYIQKQQGKGSIVLDVHRFQFPMSGLTSFKEVQEMQGMSSRTEVIQNERVLAPGFLVETGLVPSGEEMILLVRQRWIGEQVAILDKDYLRCRLVDSVPTEAVRHSLYDYLEGDLGLNIAYAKKEFTAELLSETDAQSMQVSTSTPVIAVKSEVFLEDTQFFQYTESFHQLERFKFVAFARRQLKRP